MLPASREENPTHCADQPLWRAAETNGSQSNRVEQLESEMCWRLSAGGYGTTSVLKPRKQ